MQVVIDIPEKLACEGFERPFTEEEKNILIKAIGNGTSLPKGHGRLIEVTNQLEQELFTFQRYTGIDEAPYESATIITDKAPTIIEADRAEREGME